jgi:hypothetical protein
MPDPIRAFFLFLFTAAMTLTNAFNRALSEVIFGVDAKRPVVEAGQNPSTLNVWQVLLCFTPLIVITGIIIVIIAKRQRHRRIHSGGPTARTSPPS